MTLDLVDYRSVGDAFRERVAAHPDQTAVIVVGDGGSEAERITFAELLHRSERRAADFSTRLEPGERVLIALPSGSRFVETYLACLLAGEVAVPVPVPGGGVSAADRIAAIGKDCSPKLAVTTEQHVQELADALERAGSAGIRVEASGEPSAAGPGGGRYTPEPDTVAVLQYSSGSTGTPKGAILSHRNILANVQDFARVAGFSPSDVFGIWLPLHHDMGLFAKLTTSLLLGTPIVLMQPMDFVRRPSDWLHMLTRYAVTVTSAPNFAFDLCRRVIDESRMEGVDLSRLRRAFNGSEPIHAATLATFNQRFAAVGLRPGVVSPAYGLAEATVFVSTTAAGSESTVVAADADRLRDADRPRLLPAPVGAPTERIKEMVGLGRTGLLEIRVVDPESCAELPEQSVGEVWLRGPSVGSGYWGQPETSARTFAAITADGDGGWLRTGDLGTLVDGELFITGRLKEMMIVRGRNLFPQDLEHAARKTHASLAAFVGAAFAVPAPEERIVLVHEVDPRLPAIELPAVSTSISRGLSRAFGVPVNNVMLVRRGSVRRTTSGKIQRAAMRERFLGGHLKALHAELDPEVEDLSLGGVR